MKYTVRKKDTISLPERSMSSMTADCLLIFISSNMNICIPRIITCFEQSSKERKNMQCPNIKYVMATGEDTP